VPHVVVGQVQYLGESARAADRGLQLRAGMLGADAVIDVERRRCPDMGWGAREASGVAVRVEDAAGRRRLRWRWFREEVGALVTRLLVLLVLQGALLFLVGVACAGMSRFHVATGETTQEALVSMASALGLLLAWPLVLVALLWGLRWPQLLRAASLAALTATTLRGLTVILVHLATALAAGQALSCLSLAALLDPIDWAFIIAGAVLCIRAWRLAGDAAHILPPEDQTVAPRRKVLANGLLVLTVVYGLGFLGFVGHASYQVSAHLLQPGVDSKREHEALLALNRGHTQATNGDLAAAEESWQRSLRLWEALTPGGSGPPVYRANLALTLNNLGWLRHKQGRLDEAEKYYARAVGIADQLPDDPRIDPDFKQTMADTRRALAELRAFNSLKGLDEKDKSAGRKYEEAVVKAQNGDIAAEGLFQEAIALWEEILPQVADEDYRKGATAQLALAYLHLGELRQRFEKLRDAEAALRKAIEYGEKAVALEPDRPLTKHNLDVARQMLDGLRK
jgi:tetratricopeptide (TPR) repeat protein